MSQVTFSGSTRSSLRNYFVCWLLALCTSLAHAQQPLASLSGHVTDTTGALIPGARVELQTVAGATKLSTTTDSAGHYVFDHAEPATYIVVATADGFASFRSAPITVVAAKTRVLDIHLPIADQVQQIDVPVDSGMNTDPNNNGDSLVLKGSTIDDLPTDPGEMSQELNALAGSDSPELRIDGFSGGTMPPKSSIREIRINQNPYSAQNDINPGNGMIEVFTKPGTGEVHGQFYVYGNESSLNSLSPFVKQAPEYHILSAFANVSGPITKHTSFFFNGVNNNQATNSVINAQILDANNNPVNFTQAVATPSTYTNYSTRIDTGIGKKSTLIVRYVWSSSNQNNAGIGNLSLASQGYKNLSSTQILQVSNSQILSTKIVNDTRFEYLRDRQAQTANSFDPSIVVQGAFNSGGNNTGNYRDNQDRYELQNYVSAALGKHFLTFGGRLRVARDANRSNANYNGQFVFASLDDFKNKKPSQYTQTVGNPNIVVSLTDLGLFFQDDWKTTKNLTLSGGLRFETQDHIADHADWAPRLGFAYAFGAAKDKPQVYTLRGGAGIFYKRFASGNILQAQRQNGITQNQYVINSPTMYPAIPTLDSKVPSAIFQVSPIFRAPYYLSSTVSLQRTVGKLGQVTVSYLANRGDHAQLTRNINAPLPGTYDPAYPGSGTRPLGTKQDVYEYESAGVYNSNRLSTNIFLHYKTTFSVFGYYMLRFDNTNVGSGFPSNQYDIGADYGRSPADTRHSLNVGGNLALPWDFGTGMFLSANSGAPFNIVVGQDLNGDSQYNDRPSFATDLSRPSVVKTAYGNFDTNPIAGQARIPYDSAQGPATVRLNVMMRKAFNFGPQIKAPAGTPAPKLAPGVKAPKAPVKYNVTLFVFSENVLNHVNYAPPVGTLSSPLFGKSVALTGASSTTSSNRIITADLSFRF